MAVAPAGTAVAVTGMAAAAIGAAATLGAAVAVGGWHGHRGWYGYRGWRGYGWGGWWGPGINIYVAGYGRRCWSPAYGYYPCRYRYGWGY